jgi:hypothetical protein
MTPAELQALDDDVFAAFVRYMQREAAELDKAARR